MTAAGRWSTLDATDGPAVAAWLAPLMPQEPGDAAGHDAELALYWPHVGAESWALGLEVAGGREDE